jgi:hypothetical protein
MIRSAVLAFVAALVAAGGASAEVVARGVDDGLLALNAKGAPSVAFVRGSTLVVASRSARGRWTQAKAASVSPGSAVMAFEIGAAGPVLLVENADSTTLRLVQRRSVGWQSVTLAAVRGVVRLGWPGLALDRRGLPAVGFTRWNGSSLNSRLLLAVVDAKRRVRTRPITAEGFPDSFVPPPAEPVLVGGRVHVIESYGYKGVLGTLEWFPQRGTWTGLGLASGFGDFPIGPLLAGISPNGTLHVAWTELLSYFASSPVMLVNRTSVARSRFVLDRALTTALALPPTGPEIAANEWVGPDDLGLASGDNLWAGTVVRGRSTIELDGWIAGLAVAPRGGRDLLLGGPAGLRWFHARRAPAIHMSIAAVDDGSRVELSGQVPGVTRGSVTIYRERPGQPRQAIGRAAFNGGAFSFTDDPPSRPLVYRAVYVDPASGIPYGALLRTAIRAPAAPASRASSARSPRPGRLPRARG